MRVLRVCFALALVLALPAAALAQADYPSRPVRIVVGFGPGAAADLTARVLAQRLSQTMGQQFFVENKPGGGSTVAAEQVARGPKDGYTLFVGTVANVINAVLQPDLAFDFAKDFAPIAYTTSSPNILVVHPSTGVIRRERPDRFRQGQPRKGILRLVRCRNLAASVGRAVQHDGGDQDGPCPVFRQRAGGDRSDRGPHPGDVLAGFDGAAICGIGPAQGAGVVGNRQRASAAPDLPTVAEAGLPGFDTSVWFGLVAPAGTPPEIIGKLSRRDRRGAGQRRGGEVAARGGTRYQGRDTGSNSAPLSPARPKSGTAS